MRIMSSLVGALMAVLISGAAHAQAWEEYVNRGDFFLVNFPGEPMRADSSYKTAKGTELSAHVYSAQDRRGQYRLTVVDFTSAPAELAAEMDNAAAAFRKRGTVKYDEINQLDNHRSWRISLEAGQTLILGEILAAKNNRLYITESQTAVGNPPPALFQVSLQILDDKGVRIRYAEGTPATPDEVLPVSDAAYGAEAVRVAALISGAWKAQGAACTAPVLKTGARVKTKRGEDAMAATLVKDGTTVAGQAILSGPREGQFVNAQTDMAIFLFDPQTGALPLSFLGPPTTGWPDITLTPCRG